MAETVMDIAAVFMKHRETCGVRESIKRTAEETGHSPEWVAALLGWPNFPENLEHARAVK